MNIRNVQKILSTSGFDPGPLDGIFGRRTRAALIAFQKQIGLPATGLIDPRTERELMNRAGASVDSSAFVWLEEARRFSGLKEVAGSGSNPTILDWAQDLDIQYSGDDIPWCGLFVAHCIAATLPDEPLPSNPLGARNWRRFGKRIEPGLSSILVFWRESKSGAKGHVGFYEGEDRDCFHVLGGNQSNSVSIARVAKTRLLEARWPVTATSLPHVVAKEGQGSVSDNEA